MNNRAHSLIRDIFHQLEQRYCFVGIGVNAFNRLGAEDYSCDYRIASLRYPMETRLIEKEIPVFALEKDIIPRHLNLPRNSSSVITHSLTRQWLANLPRPPVLIPYHSSRKINEVVQQQGWRLAANPAVFGKVRFSNKIVFKQLLTKLNLPAIPGETVANLGQLWQRKNYLRKRYGPKLTVQHPGRGGGRGTFFIHGDGDWRRLEKALADEENSPLLVSRFINGPSPSATGCVLEQGIVSTPLQLQILDSKFCYNLDSKTGNGRFCGHDWTNSRLLPATAKEQADRIMQAVGEYLRRRSYRGIFGIDFILDAPGRILYPVELNPRLVGTLPVLNMVQRQAGAVPILALHVLAFLGKEFGLALPLSELNNIMRRKMEGGQLILHNREGRWCRTGRQLKPGVYTLRQGEMLFIRSGYGLEAIKDRGEFVISDGVPWRGSAFSPNRRLCRVLTRRNLLAGVEANKLTPWAEQVAGQVYRAFRLRPVRFFKLKRFLNPDFMVKG